MLQDSAATRDEAAGPARCRDRRLDRRLRDRLLLAQLPPAVPGHDAEDRPRLRRRRRPRPRRLGARQRDRRAGPGPATCRSSPRAWSTGRSSAGSGRSAANSPRASISPDRSTRPAIETLLATGHHPRRRPRHPRGRAARPPGSSRRGAADRRARGALGFRFRQAPNRTFLPLATSRRPCIVGHETTATSVVDQTVCKLGKPVERRGRKARDLPGATAPEDRPVARHRTSTDPKGGIDGAGGTSRERIRPVGSNARRPRLEPRLRALRSTRRRTVRRPPRRGDHPGRPRWPAATTRRPT